MLPLQEKLEKTVIPSLAEKFKRKNRLSLPRLEKVVISMGFGRAATQGEKDRIDEATTHLMQLAGQQPVVTLAKKSVASFRVREGMKVGAKVTLRGDRMYAFLDKLMALALPRVRDFRGLPTKSFDGRGNYSIGISDQSIFPEIDADRIKHTQGMNITICVRNATDDESREMLAQMGMPFRR